MSKLEELEEELYGKGREEDVDRRMRKRITFLGTLRKLPTSWFGRSSRGDSEEKIVSVDRRALKYFLAGMFILLVVGASVFIFFYLGTRGQEVEIIIHGRDRVESGEAVTIPITLRNVSNTVLREGEVNIILPQGSVIREGGFERPAPSRVTNDIKDLAPGDEVVIDVATRMFGHEGEDKELEVRFLYRPENLQARFAVKTLKVFTISRVPLALFWKTPETLSHGQDVEMEVRYTSTARAPFDDIAFRIEYPPGFTFNSAEPEPTVGETIWEIGRLEPGEEGIITIRGSVVGEEGEIKAFRGSLGVFNSLTKKWSAYSDSGHTVKIAVAPLSVQGFLNERREYIIVSGGQPRFTIRYKNNTSSALKNVTVRAFLEGDIVLFNTLSASDGGVFDATSRALVWGPGNTIALREIAPGAEGVVSFDVTTRQQPAVRGTLDRNLVVRLRVTIEAGEIPEELVGTDLQSDDILEFKVATIVLFSGRTVQKTSPIPNTGPLPPKVGQETTYTIVWELRNFTNDVGAVEVRVPLPPNVRWTGHTFPSDQMIIFNEVAREVQWKIGTLTAGTGVLTPALVGAFQVAVVPAEVDVAKSIRLTGDPIFNGVDAFTGERIEKRLNAFNTELKEDPATQSNDWQVVP